MARLQDMMADTKTSQMNLSDQRFTSCMRNYRKREMLNQQQKIAADGLCSFVNQREHTFALLLGPAGSGKTFTVASVINTLGLKDRPVIVACPTHKAKRVLVAALLKHGITVSATTVSALIGKAPSSSDDPDEEGQAQWMVAGGSTLPANSLLVLDEISMIDFHDMKSVKKVVEMASAQAILTGDFSQLRPVKGKSIAEAVERIPIRFQLSEVMRSEAGNIVGMSKAVRTTGDIDASLADGKTVTLYNSSTDFESKFLVTEDAVAIGYTNRRVGELNHLKRRAIYGKDVKAFMQDEEVILTESPLFVTRRGSLSGDFNKIKVADNNDPLIVLHCGDRQAADVPFINKTVPYYDVQLHNPETGLEFEAKALTYDMYVNDFKPAADDLLSVLRGFSTKLGRLDDALARRAEKKGLDNHKRHTITEKEINAFFSPQEAAWVLDLPRTNPKFLTRDYDDREIFDDDGTLSVTKMFKPVKGNWRSLKKLAWARDYFGFRGQFAVLLYGHASTAHKAQGSTYQHVFVDWPNLMTIHDPADRQAACYVAVSRASDSLHIRV